MRRKRDASHLASALVVLVLSMIPAGPSGAADLHRFWEERCAKCHGEAGEFARKRFKVQDSTLSGRRSGEALKSFIRHHQGSLSPDEAEAVYGMLLAQARSTQLFRTKCGICHPKAADLVRGQIIARNGQLVGRYTDRPVADFLHGHGRVSEEEIPFFIDLLTRIEKEVHRP